MLHKTDNDIRFFLWDLNSKCVLSETSSGTAAHAASEGILNSQVHVSFLIPTNEASYFMFDIFSAGIVPANFTPSEDELNLMRLAGIRTQYLHRLEVLIQKYVHTYCSPLEVEMHNYLSTLSLGQETNVKHPMVVEYSDILNIPTIEGYNDLKMRFDSYALLKMKSFAFFEKFKRKINRCYTEEECKAVLEQTRYELYSASQI